MSYNIAEFSHDIRILIQDIVSGKVSAKLPVLVTYDGVLNVCTIPDSVDLDSATHKSYLCEEVFPMIIDHFKPTMAAWVSCAWMRHLSDKSPGGIEDAQEKVKAYQGRLADDPESIETVVAMILSNVRGNNNLIYSEITVENGKNTLGEFVTLGPAQKPSGLIVESIQDALINTNPQETFNLEEF